MGISSSKDERLGLVTGRDKWTLVWTSEARFVVAGANEFSKSQQKNICAAFSKFKVYNCNIVSLEHYVIDKEFSRPINVNDVDTDMKFEVYTWFPYQSPDTYTEVNDITLLDSWVISAQGQFTKNTDLFPRKINNNLNECPMKAVVRDGHWDFTTVYVNHTYSNGSVVTYIKGMETDLLRVVLHQTSMTFVLVPTPEYFETEQRRFHHNLITSLFEKEIFIALGGMGITFC